MGGLIRAITLPAGMLLSGNTAAVWLLRRLGVPEASLAAAARRLAGPLLAVLAVAALPLAVVETLIETAAPLDGTLLTSLLPYLLTTTLFGVVWTAQVAVLAVLAVRWRAGHAPGPLGSLALLAVWPQLAHLAPNFHLFGLPVLREMAWLALHRVGIALWLGTLAVLLFWSRPGGPARKPWAGAFFRLALPGAAALLAGAMGSVLEHGGGEAIFGAGLFARVVDVKTALLAGLLALGAVHFMRYRQHAVGAQATLAAEVALAGAAVVFGALLGVLPAPGQ